MNTKDKILKIFEGNPLYENFRLGYWRMRTRKSQKELEENAKKRANGFDDPQFSRPFVHSVPPAAPLCPPRKPFQ